VYGRFTHAAEATLALRPRGNLLHHQNVQSRPIGAIAAPRRTPQQGNSLRSWPW
jgi:hypothetical protein